MKKYFLSFAVLMMGMTLFTACSNDDDDDNNKKDPIIEEVTPYHFDLTVTVGKQGGMGRDVTTIMQTRDSLNAGADLQQSFGGLETLYGDAASAAKEYAYEAALAGISLVGCGSKAAESGAEGTDTINLGASGDAALNNPLVQLADERGYFAENYRWIRLFL